MRRVKQWTVKRSLWWRGNPDSGLRMSAGKMCCLGHRCIAQGCNAEELERRGYPSDLAAINGDLAYSLGRNYRDSKIHERAIAKINDDRSITDAEREALIIAKFAELGEAVTFVD